MTEWKIHSEPIKPIIGDTVTIKTIPKYGFIPVQRHMIIKEIYDDKYILTGRGEDVTVTRTSKVDPCE